MESSRDYYLLAFRDDFKKSATWQQTYALCTFQSIFRFPFDPTNLTFIHVHRRDFIIRNEKCWK